jgi:hypothetical protein
MKGGAEVEGKMFVVVFHGEDLPLAVSEGSEGIGEITLPGNSDIPVVLGRCRGIPQHCAEPGIFPGRLIEMAMDSDTVHEKTSFVCMMICVLSLENAANSGDAGKQMLLPEGAENIQKSGQVFRRWNPKAYRAHVRMHVSISGFCADSLMQQGTP